MAPIKKIILIIQSNMVLWQNAKSCRRLPDSYAEQWWILV